MSRTLYQGTRWGVVHVRGRIPGPPLTWSGVFNTIGSMGNTAYEIKTGRLAGRDSQEVCPVEGSAGYGLDPRPCEAHCSAYIWRINS